MEEDHNDQILCKKAVSEGLQRRLLTGSSSSIGVREDCWAIAALQHIAAHRTCPRARAMGQRLIAQHPPGGTHSHGGGSCECPANAPGAALCLAMAAPRRQGTPIEHRQHQLERCCSADISCCGVAANEVHESTSELGACSGCAQAACWTSQDALVCMPIFIEQALSSRSGWLHAGEIAGALSG